MWKAKIREGLALVSKVEDGAIALSFTNLLLIGWWLQLIHPAGSDYFANLLVQNDEFLSFLVFLLISSSFFYFLLFLSMFFMSTKW